MKKQLKQTKRPKWAENLAREGWMPHIGGYRHVATGVCVVRTMNLDDADDEPMWRTLTDKGELLGEHPSLTEAMAFAETTVLLMEE